MTKANDIKIDKLEDLSINEGLLKQVAKNSFVLTMSNNVINSINKSLIPKINDTIGTKTEELDDKIKALEDAMAGDDPEVINPNTAPNADEELHAAQELNPLGW